MSRPTAVILLACALLPASPSALALTDRDHLLKWCSHESMVAAGRCIGYLLAAEDALARDSIEGVRACLPADIGLQSQHRLVLDWLKTHPEAEAATALGLVARAYAEHYPCPAPR
jgi:hypothetical protein